MLSFYIFCVLIVTMVLVSLFDKEERKESLIKKVDARPAVSVIIGWVALSIVMVCLYLFFNGH